MGLKPIILDTNGYTAFKLGKPEAIELIQHVSQIGINSIVLGELLGGFALGNQRERNEQELNRFLASPRVITLEITSQTAAFYARVFLDLRQKGRPIPTNDMWIAASALQYDYAIFTYDQHFTYIDGLLTVSSLADIQ
jgi:predicted nucleic acid-binding protein